MARTPRAGRERGLRLTMLAGMAFGVLDVLAPLRLAELGATANLIAATFLAASAIEAGLHHWPAGKLTAGAPSLRSGSRWWPRWS